MIAGAVHGFDADEVAVAVAEGRELPLLAIAAYHDAIIAGGQARHLQFVRSLVAPEPRQPVIGLGMPREPRGDAAGMVGGFLHRFQPQRAAEPLALVERAIADRRDV